MSTTPASRLSMVSILSVLAVVHASLPPNKVEIWSKAAIGEYLWQHVLLGDIEPRLQGIWSYGRLEFVEALQPTLELTLRTGPGVLPQKIPKDTRHAVLVINGRTEEKIAFAKTWLEMLPRHPALAAVGLVLLGNEKCHNDWLLSFLDDPAYHIKFVLLVYGDKELQAHPRVPVFQWPLGVATYRKFPAHVPWLAGQPRKHVCNFFGTVYPGSSRETLLALLQQRKQCLVKARHEWQASEDKQSLGAYVDALVNSHATLSPAGFNTECYRIYEAAAAGSTVVMEDNPQPARCPGPVGLLKAAKAPFHYLSSWGDGQAALVLDSLHAQSEHDQINQRRRVREWYEGFKFRLQRFFLLLVRKQLLSV
eukprot:m.216162 g.216162  ORF g.216162 m.216162 type:complete len:365 (-) comp18652_c1_seq1:170-1264(-)